MRTNWVRMTMVIALVAAAGCGKKVSESVAEKIAEKAIEQQSGGKASVDIASGKTTVKTAEGTFTVDASGGASIPENFPKDVPVPKSTKVTSSVSTPQGVNVTLEGPADVAETVKAFSDEMKSQGWTEEVTSNMGGQLVSSFKKGERSTAITAIATGDKSVITITAMLTK